MSPDLGHGQMTFRTTHWTVIRAAQQRDESTTAREAMASLCAAYWPPLYAFIRRAGYGPEDAEDLTQEFFRHFLEHDSLKNVAPERGKFRSFLLACLKQFLSKQRDRALTVRRGGGQKLVPLDCAESDYSLELADHLTPEALFDRRWAVTILNRTLEDLRREYARRQRPDLFEDLFGFLPGTQTSPSRDDLAAKHNITVGALDVAIHRLRQRFGALLRERIAQTVSVEDEVDEELDYLMRVIGNGS